MGYVVMEDALKYLEAIGELDPHTAYFAVDDKQQILFWSKGAQELLGYEAEEVTGRHCSVAINCVTCSSGCGLKLHGRIENRAVTHYHKNGGKAPLIKKAIAFSDDGDVFKGGLEILTPDDRETGEEAYATSGVLTNFHGILTSDSQFLALLTSLRHAAYTDVNMLVRGESGSGKEMVARAIHQMSLRKSKPFVAINCGALSREFLASELFGHRKGAFTGASSDKKGLLAEAETGTLFLDEVAELPMEVQTMLLRVVQERKYRPLGHTRDFNADVRLICATHVSLRQAVKEGRFREDLMYRLRVVPVFLPPLRDRRGDIALLWHEMLGRSARKFNLTPPKTSKEVLEVFRRHPWPGNVRELCNVAEYVAVTRADQVVGVEHLPPEFRDASQAEASVSDTPKRGKPGIEDIKEALDRSGGNTEEAAQYLGVSRATLWRWRKRFGIQ